MTAPLISRLELAIAASTDPVQKAELSAQIACYWARIGEFEKAETRRIELRKGFGDGRSASVSILIMCLEALLLYYKDLDHNARDRLARANLLSVACHQLALTALTYSWLAHIDFNMGRYEVMATEIAKAMEAMHADDGTALCRASLVLGDAMCFIGRDGGARKWYEQARIIANRLGDQAAIGAITYNWAALRVAAARVEYLYQSPNSSRLVILDAEVRSAVNYQSIANLSSLDHLLQSATIGVLMLEARYAQAIEAIGRLLATSSVPSDSSELALLYADLAVAHCNMGNLQVAAGCAETALAINKESFGADDRALLHGALKDFSKAVGDAAGAEHHKGLCDAALCEHQATMQRIESLLQPYLNGPVGGS